MFKEFKEFALKGNMLDMAVGIIIGGAFGKIISSFVTDVLMPPLGLLLGRVNLTDLFVTLGGGTYATLAAAKEAGAITVNVGIFLNTVIDFLLVALAVFLMVRQVNRLRKEEAPAAPTTRDCPFCLTAVPLGARRCPHCTSEISPA
jgi:large conductance mechanosensitive channel